MRINYAIVFVSNMAKSVAFYRDVVGIPLRFESQEWTEFATEGATLALHSCPGDSAKRAESDHTPAGSCCPGLSVEDIDSFHATMLAHGVTCLRPPTSLHGTMLAEYLDPDGLAISVSTPRTS